MKCARLGAELIFTQQRESTRKKRVTGRVSQDLHQACNCICSCIVLLSLAIPPYSVSSPRNARDPGASVWLVSAVFPSRVPCCESAVARPGSRRKRSFSELTMDSAASATLALSRAVCAPVRLSCAALCISTPSRAVCDPPMLRASLLTCLRFSDGRLK